MKEEKRDAEAVASDEVGEKELDQVSGGVMRTDYVFDKDGNVLGYSEVFTRSMKAEPWKGGSE